jgi:hypothetical protein
MKNSNRQLFVIPALWDLQLRRHSSDCERNGIMSIITRQPAKRLFRYVNGTWLDNTEIPSDRTRW